LRWGNIRRREVDGLESLNVRSEKFGEQEETESMKEKSEGRTNVQNEIRRLVLSN
jgi:hypothetical protein